MENFTNKQCVLYFSGK